MAQYIDLRTTIEILKEAYKQSSTTEEALAKAQIVIEKVATNNEVENAKDYASTVIVLAQQKNIDNINNITINDINAISQTTYSTVTSENLDVIWSLDKNIEALISDVSDSELATMQDEQIDTIQANSNKNDSEQSSEPQPTFACGDANTVECSLLPTKLNLLTNQPLPNAILIASIGSSENYREKESITEYTPSDPEHDLNYSPVAQNISINAEEDGPIVTGDFNADDSNSNDTTSTLQYTVIEPPNEGMVINHNNGTYSFDPQSNFQYLAQGEIQTITFTYRAQDSYGEYSNTATASILITGHNDAPIAQDISNNAEEDGPSVTGNFSADDIDSDDTPTSLSYAIIQQPTEGLVTNNNDGTYSFDPQNNFQDLAEGETRTVTFTYKATDSHGADSNTATATIEATGRNDTPIANNDSNTVTEDNILLVSGNLLTNDSDIDASDSISIKEINNTITPTGISSGQYGTLSWTQNGNYSYLLDNNNPTVQALNTGDSLVENFTYLITDDNSGTATASLSINILGEDDGPTAVDDYFTMQYDDVLTVNVFNTNTTNTSQVTIPNHDTDDGLISVSLFTEPHYGQVSFTKDGEMVYQPTVNFNAREHFFYQIEDESGNTDTARVEIFIEGNSTTVSTSSSDAPVFLTQILLPLTYIGNNVTWTGAGNNDSFIHALTPLGNPNASSNYLDITGYGGNDSILIQKAATYLKNNITKVDAGAGDDVMNNMLLNGQVSITGHQLDIDLGAGNDILSMQFSAPIMMNNDIQIKGGQGSDTITISGYHDASNPIKLIYDEVPTQGSIDILNASLSTSNLMLSLNSNNFTPSGNILFSSNIIYYDPLGNGTTDKVALLNDVNNILDSSHIAYYNGTTATGTNVTTTQTPTFSNTTLINHLPNALDDTFTISANLSSANVLADNGQGLDTDIDPTDTDLNVIAINNNALLLGQPITLNNGIATLTSNGHLSYQQNPSLTQNQSVTDILTYTISDGRGGIDNATISFNVHGQNDAPTALDDMFQSSNASGVNVLSNDSDPENDTLAITAATLSGNNIILGQQNIISDITITLTTNGNFSYSRDGAAIEAGINYAVTDGNGGNGSAQIILEQDLPPIANTDSISLDLNLGATGGIGVTMYMFDAFGDGWDWGSSVTTNHYIIQQSSNTVISSRDFVNATSASANLQFSSRQDTFELQPGTYTIEVQVGSWISEVSWYLKSEADEYLVSPVASASAIGSFLFTISSVTATANQYSTITGMVAGIDPEGTTSLSYELVTSSLQTTEGLVTVNPVTGKFTYSTNGNFLDLTNSDSAVISFDIAIKDAHGSDIVSVDINLYREEIIPPEARDDEYFYTQTPSAQGNVLLGTQSGISIGGTDEDSDGGTLSIQAINGINLPTASNPTPIFTTFTESGIPTAFASMFSSVVQMYFLSDTAGIALTATANITPQGAISYNQISGTENNSLTYTITDNQGGIDNALVSFGFNTPPTAVDDYYTELGTSNLIVGDLFTNDFDANSDPLHIIGVLGGAVGVGVTASLGDSRVFRVDESGIFLYHNFGASPIDTTTTLTVTISDYKRGTDTAQIFIQPLNNPPTAQDDMFLLENTSFLFGNVILGTQNSTAQVSGTDSDPEGDLISINGINGIEMQPTTQLNAFTSLTDITGIVFSSGALIQFLNSTGLTTASAFITDQGFFTYNQFSGTETNTLAYTITDGNGGTDTALITFEQELPGLTITQTITNPSSSIVTLSGSNRDDTVNLNINMFQTALFNNLAIHGYDGDDTLNLNIWGVPAVFAFNTITMNGNNGNDLLQLQVSASAALGFNLINFEGGTGNDTLSYSDSAAYYYASPDIIRMNGGEGQDNFIINDKLGSANSDIIQLVYNSILDLSSGPDSVAGNQADRASFEFSRAGGFLGDNNSDGALDTTSFLLGPSPTAADSNDYWLYDTNNNTLYYDNDGNGPNAQIAVAEFDTGVIVTASEINFT